MSITLINLTPHPIHLLDDSNKIILTINPEDTPARVSTENTWLCDFEAENKITIPLFSTSFNEVENLPERKIGQLLIVSTIVKAACPARDDVVVPHHLVRNSDGQIIGCQSFRR